MRFGAMMLAAAACLTMTVGAFGQAKPKITIGMVAKSNSNPVFTAAHQGAKDAAKELGEKYGPSVCRKVASWPSWQAGASMSGLP